MKLIIGQDTPYFSQRNNELDPAVSCQCTAMVQALAILGYQFPAGRHAQPEDNLRSFIKGQGCNPEIHATLSKLTNMWMGRTVTHFSTDVLIADIFYNIDAALPVVLSGSFPGFPTPRKTPLGHIVTLVGHDENGVVVMDPYGNTLDDWKGSGRQVLLSMEQFFAWIKPANNARVKWAHLFETRKQG
jgi:hypothetical protein